MFLFYEAEDTSIFYIDFLISSTFLCVFSIPTHSTQHCFILYNSLCLYLSFIFVFFFLFLPGNLSRSLHNIQFWWKEKNVFIISCQSNVVDVNKMMTFIYSLHAHPTTNTTPHSTRRQSFHSLSLIINPTNIYPILACFLVHCLLECILFF